MIPVTTAMVLDVLAPFSPEVTESCQGWLSFTQVRLLSTEEQDCSSSILYVATEEELTLFAQAHPAQAPALSVVCVAEGKADCPGNGFPLLIWIGKGYTLSQVFNCIQELFFRFFQWEADLNQAVYTESSLQQMVDIGERMFANPLLIWDAAFNLHAYSRHCSIDDRVIQKIIDHGFFTSSLVQHIISTGLMASPEHQNQLRVIQPDELASDCTYYIHHYFREGHRTFSAALAAKDRQPSPGELDLLRYFFHMLEIYINAQSTSKQNYHQLYELFLHDLLDQKLTDEKEIADRASAFNVPLRKDYLFYCIEFDSFTITQAEFLIYSLRQTLPHERFIIRGENVCLLKAVDAYSCDTDESRGRFSTLLATYNARCGLSRIFQSLTECHTAFMQASAALRLGKKMEKQEDHQRVFRYPKYAVYHMLDMCAEKVDLLSLLPRSMIRFYETERASGGNDIELLRTFMDTGMSVAATAQATFLHRNSVAYRLKRMETQFNMEFNSGDAMTDILLFLHIVSYLEAQ